eukprot:6649206-Prymnesium_polylepis.1
MSHSRRSIWLSSRNTVSLCGRGGLTACVLAIASLIGSIGDSIGSFNEAAGAGSTGGRHMAQRRASRKV